MANPLVVSLINRYSRKYGVDPNAVYAVSRGEGGLRYGAVGDGGHAFGPFQLNDAGGVLTNRPGSHSAFANSPAGIEFAIRSMSQSGARGKKGRAAVRTIITNFERPKDIPTSIANALGRLGSGAQFAGTPPRGVPTSSSGTPNLGALGSVLQSNNELIGVPSLPMDMGVPQVRRGGLKVQVDHPDPLSPNARPIVQQAKQYLGTKYVWGGATPKGFDCSGFVQYLYAQRGVKLPRTTYGQIKAGKKVGLNQLQAGDVVFFSKSGDVHHEGLYIGNGQFIHAPHTGDVVKISSLSDPYYQQQFAGGRRFV